MSCKSCHHPSDLKAFAALVKDYKNHHQKEKNLELRYFEQMNFEQVLKKVAYAKNQNDRKFSHQRRLPQAVSKSVLNVLLGIKKEIKEIQNFEQLYALLEQQLLPIRGIGDLFIFDAALRIAAKLNYQPTEIIVQSGSKQGVRNLGLKVKNKRVTLDQLPSIIRDELEPYEIENFLCIYREEFRNLENN